jgi:predicted transcriptional regulator
LNDRERDLLRRRILESISRGCVRWTSIEKRVCSSCFKFATSNTMRRQFYSYLLAYGYVQRVGRGRYALTCKGEKLLKLLSTP